MKLFESGESVATIAHVMDPDGDAVFVLTMHGRVDGWVNLLPTCMTAHELQWFAAMLWREAVKAEPVQPDRVLVHMEGGVLEDIEGIPADVVLEVRDYDTDGTERDEGLDTDADGRDYIWAEWQAPAALDTALDTDRAACCCRSCYYSGTGGKRQGNKCPATCADAEACKVCADPGVSCRSYRENNETKSVKTWNIHEGV